MVGLCGIGLGLIPTVHTPQKKKPEESYNNYTMKYDVLETQWADAILLETQVARIIRDQEKTGWLLDQGRCQELIDELNRRIEETDRHILPLTKPRVIRDTEVKAPFKKDGKLSDRVLRYFGENAGDYIRGPFTKLSFETINLGSATQVKEYLFSIGWEPDEWNVKETLDPYGRTQYTKTTPKLTTSSLLKLGKVGELLDHRTVLTHRRNQLEGFLRNVREDGRIEARANSIGTNTCRMTHSIVVNVPKAKDSVFFGKEMRSVFTVPEGKLLVGGDAAGLENRIIVHFLGNPDAIPIFTEGDFHTKFWKAIEQFCSTRDQAKNIEYAYFFGASDNKLARMADRIPVGTPMSDIGPQIRAAINDKVKGLDDLIQRVKLSSRSGYVVGLDNRKLRVRGEHSAFNTLIQGSGAIFMKRVLVILDNWIQSCYIDAKFVANIHDEFVLEVAEDQALFVKALFEEAIREAARYYKLKCPMMAGVKIGKNWSELK